MNQQFRLGLCTRLQWGAALSGLLLVAGCTTPMSAEEIEQRTALRDARCESLKQQIDAAHDKPLQRDYLLRRYDAECRKP